MITFHNFEAAHDIPDIYWNVRSNEQRVKEICKWLNKVSEYENYLSDELGLAQENITALQEVVEKIESGEYTEQYIDGLIAYFDDYIVPMIGRIIKYVYPALTWDGNAFRFSFEIPEEWSFLKIAWIYDEHDNTYHMTLNFVDESIIAYNRDVEILSARQIALDKKIKALQKELHHNE